MSQSRLNPQLHKSSSTSALYATKPSTNAAPHSEHDKAPVIAHVSVGTSTEPLQKPIAKVDKSTQTKPKVPWYRPDEDYLEPLLGKEGYEEILKLCESNLRREWCKMENDLTYDKRSFYPKQVWPLVSALDSFQKLAAIDQKLKTDLHYSPGLKKFLHGFVQRDDTEDLILYIYTTHEVPEGYDTASVGCLGEAKGLPAIIDSFNITE